MSGPKYRMWAYFDGDWKYQRDTYHDSLRDCVNEITAVAHEYLVNKLWNYPGGYDSNFRENVEELGVEFFQDICEHFTVIWNKSGFITGFEPRSLKLEVCSYIEVSTEHFVVEFRSAAGHIDEVDVWVHYDVWSKRVYNSIIEAKGLWK